jgi:hypothetical protein
VHGRAGHYSALVSHFRHRMATWLTVVSHATHLALCNGEVRNERRLAADCESRRVCFDFICYRVYPADITYRDVEGDSTYLT